MHDFVVLLSREKGAHEIAAGREAAAISSVEVSKVVVAAAAYSGKSLGRQFFGMGEVFDGQRGHGKSPGSVSVWKSTICCVSGGERTCVRLDDIPVKASLLCA